MPRKAVAADPPPYVGTISLVFTDIEGSTELLRALGGGYGRLLTEHARILRAAAERHGGREVDTQGDAFFFVFPRAADAVSAAADIQTETLHTEWPDGVSVRIRVGVHTGEPTFEDGRYIGLDVHRAARICAAAHGRQVLLSETAARLAVGDLSDGIDLIDLGEVHLKDFEQPERVAQLRIAGVPASFPPPRGFDGAGPGSGPAVVEMAELTASPAGTAFELGLLGPVTVSVSGRQREISAGKHRMILAALGLRAGEVVSPDALIDILWGERPPATAAKALQVYVSELRSKIEPDRKSPVFLTSHPAGYRLSAPADCVDLMRFERMWASGREALSAGDAREARTLLRQALALWRGEPLSDLRFEDAFGPDIRRLEELRLGCIEDRLDADLACGEAASLVPELEALTAAYPFRERLMRQLMLALYRAGRQTDALAAYATSRERLVDEFGIDPSPELAQLERRILNQDPDLAAPVRDGRNDALRPAATRSLLAVSQSSADLDALASFACAITAAGEGRELVVARVISAGEGDANERLRRATARLAEWRERAAQSAVELRGAAFVSKQPSQDLLKLADHQAADLLLVDGRSALVDGRFGIVDALIAGADCDVAVHIPRSPEPAAERLLVPFGGSEHDWAALELAAVLSRHSGNPIVLAGADRGESETDASRLLATASLVLQRVGDVVPEPLLVAPGAEGILAIASGAHVIAGLSSRFREEGLGDTRFRLVHEAEGPVTLVRRGSRPGVLAPERSMTRFAWSLSAR